MNTPVKKTQDEEHLDLLGIFFYVLGGMTAFFACIPIIHLIIGLSLVFGQIDVPEDERFIGWFFVAIAVVIILIGWTIAICLLVTGSKLRKRQSYTFCMVIAAIACLNMPLGTILGVFTIVVLSRDSVKALFEEVRVG